MAGHGFGRQETKESEIKMILVKPSATIETITPDALRVIESAGRTCYKSEETREKQVEMLAKDEHFIKSVLGDDFGELDTNKIHISAEKKVTEDFVSSRLKSGHESVIEHASATVRFIVDRGVSHELVRHRLSSFSQESTRYVRSSSKTIAPLAIGDYSDDDIVSKYESGLSMKKISKLTCGRLTEWGVYKILDNAKVKRRPYGNTGVIYDNYFDIIDTVEKAYLIGFIQADGSLRRDGNQVTITQNKDISWYLWCMLREFVKPNIGRGNDGSCHSLSFSNTKIYQALLSKGIVPNKSREMTKNNSIDLWSSIPDGLKWSFLRGLLDGDGSIRFFNQKNKGETFSCSVSWLGKDHLLSIISDFFYKELGYFSNVVNHGDNLYQVYITTPSVGIEACRRMLDGFVFPFGNPVKTPRMMERLSFDNATLASWGDRSFKVIIPSWVNGMSRADWTWAELMDKSELSYASLCRDGWTSQQARSVLPNSTKTEVVMTANLREWRHVLKLRTSKAAHPQMREVMIPLLNEFKEKVPVVFDDINI